MIEIDVYMILTYCDYLIIDKDMILQELYIRQHLCKKSIKLNRNHLVCVKEIMYFCKITYAL